MRSTACTSIAMDHPHLQRLQELRKFWGDAMLTEKRIAKWALKHKYFYKTWIWDERWEMEVEVGEDDYDEMDVEFWRIERWAERMEMTREKSASTRERTEMERAERGVGEKREEREWEEKERDGMEREDEREEWGQKRFLREGGMKAWRKKREELLALRLMWKGWHSSK